MTNKFADEETVSISTYGSAYRGPKPIAEQAAILHEAFPRRLGSFDKTIEAMPFSQLMEGYFAIPRWLFIAPTYGQAIEKVLAAIAKKRSLYNYCEGQLGSQQLKETSRKANAFQKLREKQFGHDILVVAGQFGKRHAGCSVRRAREVFMGKEFGFGAYEVAIMLLTHPERLTAYEDLWIDCAGDKCVSEDGGGVSECLYWYFFSDMLRLRSGNVDDSREYCGSSSGCLPE